MNFIEWLQSKNKNASRSKSPPAEESDDEPLAVRRQSLQPEPKARKSEPPKKGKPVDWFEFFLNAGCGIDECTRYAEAFERDKIDEALLPDITHQTMRSIGLKEGDIIRVSKAIAQRHPNRQTAAEEQMKKDEEYARKLQEEENNGNASPKRQTGSVGLFAGPGGALKNNTRRGRPQPSKSAPPANVDLISISTASEQLTRQGSPSIPRVSSPQSAGAGPPRANSAAPVVSGFDDDAWTNRPSSTQPPAATPPATTARAPSAPPTTAQSPPAPPPAPPAPTPPAAITSPTKNLAHTTESDVFDQLARLTALKTQSPATQSPVPAPVSNPVSPPVISPPPGFQNGMGMGPSPVPMGQIQTQPTGVQVGAPRGPFAPVPQNQGLLQPLVPTSTGFNSFVPTRPQSNPPPPIPPLPTGFNANPSPQPSFLQTQPTGFQAPQQTGFPGAAPQSAFPSSLNAQPTGFGGPIQPQQTGFPTLGPLMSQTTSYPGAFAAGPFSGGRAFGTLQPSMIPCIFLVIKQRH